MHNLPPQLAFLTVYYNDVLDESLGVMGTNSATSPGPDFTNGLSHTTWSPQQDTWENNKNCWDRAGGPDSTSSVAFWDLYLG